LPLFAAVPLFSQILVDTFAGGKIRSGVPALEVEVADVSGIAWDSAGNVVFSEASTNVIRRIRTDGTIETVAGTGVAGSAGDGGPATKALLNGPASPRYDAAGNLYFADNANYRIRRIDPGGTITTVAGDGIRFEQGMDSEGPATIRSLGGIADIAVDGAGNVYFSEDGRIRRL
jgi:sugar lactone lactonase YvrE